MSQGSDTATPSSRAETAAELDRIIEQVVALGNTKVGSEYLFGGGETATPVSGRRHLSRQRIGRQAEIAAGYVIDTNHTGRQLLVSSGVVTSLAAMRDALRAGTATGVAATIGGVDTAFDQVQVLLAETGARSRQLDTAAENLTASESTLTTGQSADQGISVEEAATRMVSVQTALQAALTSTSQVISMSLVNYLGERRADRLSFVGWAGGRGVPPLRAALGAPRLLHHFSRGPPGIRRRAPVHPSAGRTRGRLLAAGGRGGLGGVPPRHPFPIFPGYEVELPDDDRRGRPADGAVGRHPSPRGRRPSTANLQAPVLLDLEDAWAGRPSWRTRDTAPAIPSICGRCDPCPRSPGPNGWRHWTKVPLGGSDTRADGHLSAVSPQAEAWMLRNCRKRSPPHARHQHQRRCEFRVPQPLPHLWYAGEVDSEAVVRLPDQPLGRRRRRRRHREQLRATGRSLQAAQRNATQANAVLQIADGAVSTVAQILDRMKELATQAASDNSGTDGRVNLDAEYQALVLEIDRIANTT